MTVIAIPAKDIRNEHVSLESHDINSTTLSFNLLSVSYQKETACMITICLVTYSLSITYLTDKVILN